MATQNRLDGWRRRYNSSPLAKSAKTVLRNVKADSWIKEYQRRLKKPLVAFVRECAKRIGNSLPPLPVDYQTRIRDQLYAVQKPLVLAMVEDGYVLAGEELRGPTKAAQEKVRIGKRPTSFLLNIPQPNVEKWLRSIASIQTRSVANRISAIHKMAAQYWDEEKQRGMTPREIAKVLVEKGIIDSEHRARMNARTNTIWSYNEGAEQRYKESGVTVKEWMATEDDLTCPFCMSLDGKRVLIDDAFLAAGTEFGVLDQGKTRTMKIPGEEGCDVRHPPAHVNCRCTLLPVLPENL